MEDLKACWLIKEGFGKSLDSLGRENLALRSCG